MGTPFSITSSRFGSNKILRKLSNTSWRVRCNCGAEREVVKSDLGTPCSGCGATPSGKEKYTKDPVLSDVISRYQASAERRKIKWLLSNEQAEKLLRRQCHYCGGYTSSVSDAEGGQKVFYSGIDRIDSDGDYEHGNVVPCCGTCNGYKNVKKPAKFIEQCRIIAEMFPIGRERTLPDRNGMYFPE